MSTPSSRRNFLRSAAVLPFLSAIDPVFAKEAIGYSAMKDPDAVDSLFSDEDFWGWVRESYTVSPNIINLNNGGVAPQPKVVQDAHIRYYQYANEAPSYYMCKF